MSDFKNETKLLSLLLEHVLVLRQSYLTVKKIDKIQPPKDIPFIQLEKCANLLLSLLAENPSMIDHKQAFITLWLQVQHYLEQAELFHKTQEGFETKFKKEDKSFSLFGKPRAKNLKMQTKEKST